MRNWKSGRICNYLMKGLLLCALVVGGWFTAGIGAKAESLTHSVEFKSEESQIVQFERADGLEQHIEVTNNTQRPMKVTFSHNVLIRNYHTELRIGGHEVASRYAICNSNVCTVGNELLQWQGNSYRICCKQSYF